MELKNLKHLGTLKGKVPLKDHRSENVISILENDEMYQEDHFISKEDVLGLSGWLGSY